MVIMDPLFYFIERVIINYHFIQTCTQSLSSTFFNYLLNSLNHHKPLNPHKSLNQIKFKFWKFEINSCSIQFQVIFFILYSIFIISLCIIFVLPNFFTVLQPSIVIDWNCNPYQYSRGGIIFIKENLYKIYLFCWVLLKTLNVLRCLDMYAWILSWGVWCVKACRLKDYSLGSFHSSWRE